MNDGIGLETPSGVQQPISGSYDPADCRFLLTPLRADFTSVEEKERLIQSGRRHYSQMISREPPPSPEYVTLFREVTARHAARLAGEILAVARHLVATRPAPLTIVSLARAGTPIGALIQRALVQMFGVDCVHYSISIIRDRGIDEQALAHVLRVARRPAAGIAFVDAWTAKGVITRELKSAIACWNARHSERLSDVLHVISDIGGSADIAATREDYAIPSGILNATVSGLVSRSILNESIAPGQFHGCVVHDELAGHDLTRWFLDEISAQFPRAEQVALSPEPRHQRAVLTAACIRDWMERYSIANSHHVKPGIAEATRVMLRRVPSRLVVRDPDMKDVRHLLHLATAKGVPVSIEKNMPFNAAAFIKSCTGVGMTALGVTP